MKIYAFLAAVLIFLNGCASSHMGSTGGVAGSRKWAAKEITPLANPSESSNEFSNNSEQARTQSSPSLNATVIANGPGDDGMVEIPLYRERLEVGTRLVPKGGVVLRKVVETNTRTIPVELRREELVIERVSGEEADGFQASGSGPGSTSGARAFEGREVLIQLHREEPVVQKSATASEVVRARKTIDTRNEVVSGTLRREMIDIDHASTEPSDAPRAASNGATSEGAFAGSSPSNVQGAGQGTSKGVQTPTSEEQDGAELFLHREELQVRKRIVPSGQVTLRKNIATEEVTREVELREEDIRVERAPASDQESSAATAHAFTPREIFIPLQQEVPTVQKQVELVEVIRAGKRIDTEQQNVSGEVRSERVEVAETRSDRSGQQNEPSGAAQGRPAPAAQGTADSESEER